MSEIRYQDALSAFHFLNESFLFRGEFDLEVSRLVSFLFLLHVSESVSKLKFQKGLVPRHILIESYEASFYPIEGMDTNDLSSLKLAQR